MKRALLIQHLETLRERFARSNDPERYALTSIRLARLKASDDLAATEKLLQEAGDKLRGLHRPTLQAKLLLSFADLGCGSRDEQHRALDEAERLWVNHPAGQAAILKTRARVYQRYSELKPAADVLAEARAAVLVLAPIEDAPSAQPAMVAELGYEEALICLELGLAERALTVLRDSSGESAGAERALLESAGLVALARVDDAIAILSRALEAERHNTQRAILWLRLAHTQHEHDRLDPLQSTLTARSRHELDAGQRAHFHALAGSLAHQRGRSDEAARHFALAENLGEAEPFAGFHQWLSGLQDQGS